MPLLIALVLMSFLEVAITVLLTRYFGALQTYSLFAIPTLIGLFIQWRRKPIMKAAWDKMDYGVRKGDTYEQRMRGTRPSAIMPFVEVFTYWVSVLLLAIPGPLTALIGFCLMLPCVKASIFRADLKQNKAYRRTLQEWKRQQPRQSPAVATDASGTQGAKRGKSKTTAMPEMPQAKPRRGRKK